MIIVSRIDDTQADFQEGVLTDVEADAGGFLRLADVPVLDFDGVDYDYVDCGNSYIGDGSFTVDFWVKTTSTDGRFVCKDSDSSSAGIGGMWGIHPIDGKLRFFYRGATTVILDGLTSINDNIWHHIACVRNPSIGIRRIYIDGNLDTELTSGDTTVYSVNSNITLGGELPNSFEQRKTQCVLSELRIWNVARTQAEIQADMNKRLTGNESGLVAYYPLDEGTGTTATDNAGANNGTIYGATWVQNEPLYFMNPDENNNRICPQIDLSKAVTVKHSSISWTETLNGQTINIETRVSFDGGLTWTPWSACVNGGSIPNLTPSAQVVNALLECRQNLSTTNPVYSPQLHTLNITVEGIGMTLFQSFNF